MTTQQQHAAETSKGAASRTRYPVSSAAFERQRLALFERYGFQGEGRRITDRQGRSTYVITRGDGPRPTVLIHGGLSQASEWALLAGQLPGHVIIPDRPGCGLSYPIDYRKVPDFRKAAADWLLDLLDGIGANQADLVGNSMGGFFSIALALAHPDRVRRLVMVGAPPGLDRTVPLFLRLWGNPILGPLINRQKITDPETLRKRVFAPLLVAHPERVPLDFLELGVAAMALPGYDHNAYSLLRRITTLRGLRSELMVRDDLRRLTVPTLFLWGDADAFVPPSIGREVAARMTNAQIEILPDTGHLPYVDHPDIVASAITQFLN